MKHCELYKFVVKKTNTPVSKNVNFNITKYSNF